MQHSKLPPNVPDCISDDSDEEKDYIALRSLVLYGNESVCLLYVFIILLNFQETNLIICLT